MLRLARFIVLTLFVSGLAQAADTSALEQKAKAAFALGRYAEAGENYEKAFEVRTDSAFLYNAAQSYRLAGNKERALLLYENYLRVFGDQDKGAEIQTCIDELTAAIAHDQKVAPSPPTATEKTKGATAEVTDAKHMDAITNAPPPKAEAATPVVSQPASPPDGDSRPVYARPRFWAVAGVAVAAVAVTLWLVLGRSTEYRNPSLGSADYTTGSSP